MSILKQATALDAMASTKLASVPVTMLSGFLGAGAMLAITASLLVLLS